MAASKIDIWRHARNIVNRAGYGVGGKEHFEIQKKRMANMAGGGNGGEPNSTIMTDTSGHEASIRDLHFADWKDSDFQSVLDAVQHWEDGGELPPKPEDDSKNKIEEAVARAYDALKDLNRDDRIDALNALAEGLGVMEPEEG